MDDYYGNCNFEDAKDLLIHDYVSELELDQEQTVTLTRREWIDLYYSCAHAEMMWRKRSQNPDIDSQGKYADGPEEFEATCRSEMRKLRLLQGEIGGAINF